MFKVNEQVLQKTHEIRFFLQYCETLKLLNLLKKTNQMFALCRLWKFYVFADCQTHVTFKHKNIFSRLFLNCLCNHVQPLKVLHSEHKVTTKQQALIPKRKDASNMGLQQAS